MPAAARTKNAEARLGGDLGDRQVRVRRALRVYLVTVRRAPAGAVFPYTTLFRSAGIEVGLGDGVACRAADRRSRGQVGDRDGRAAYEVGDLSIGQIGRAHV